MTAALQIKTSKGCPKSTDALQNCLMLSKSAKSRLRSSTRLPTTSSLCGSTSSTYLGDHAGQLVGACHNTHSISCFAACPFSMSRHASTT